MCKFFKSTKQDLKNKCIIKPNIDKNKTRQKRYLQRQIKLKFLLIGGFFMLKKFKNKKQAIIMIISTIILLITGTAAIAIIYKNNQENETIEVLSKYGSRGSEVTQIQTKLKRWGYYSGNIDGIYGTQTVKAVKYFQRKNRLTADGIAGPATLKAMGITSSSSTSSSTSSYNSNLNLLARVIYGESRGEPYTGQVAVGAVVMSFFHSAYYAYAGLPGLLTIVNAISKDAPMSFIGEALACVIAFVITIVAIQIVGFDDPVDEAEESEEETKKITGTEMLSGEKQEQKEQTAEIKKIESPLAGTVIPLSEVHDEVFASEMMGKGCAVIPEEGKVYAPFDGKVVGLLDSHHAVGMESTDGVEILIHVGMDTVKLNGRCFTIHVEEGEQVKKGQLLLEFDIPGIKEAGYEVTTPIVVTNSDEFNDVEMKAEGQVTVGVELLELS